MSAVWFLFGFIGGMVFTVLSILAGIGWMSIKDASKEDND